MDTAMTSQYPMTIRIHGVPCGCIASAQHTCLKGKVKLFPQCPSISVLACSRT